MQTPNHAGSTAREPRDVLAMIDHSILKPDATESDIVAACELAASLGVACVCVQPCWASKASRTLEGTGVKVGSVLGFPHGATTTEAKLMEAIVLLEARVNEIDMVMNIGWLKSRRLDEVGEEIGALHAILSVGGVTFKVILETGYLTDEEKVLAAELAARYGADFVKTSTGFGPSGATASDVRLLRQSVPQSVGVKAAGGIRTLAQVEEMLTAGATRIGTSATRAIASELGVEA